ncbi:N-acyltransferase YncA [Pseudovibrio axinellae]|uniref:N-acyltransferase YncA n=1 Tax=Pseudovibrio axinellae TaxID=989403 RepID=A0A166BAG3_9HYPH|nr:GNAT family N-acetyltransferase [Pseudovibrio axinellae]KZL22067.1 N-acyltransferase YncA [Pseudovibrio axinellae]SEQ56509.1 phosphinothricin acetyltransferase [Pseudovibrio axinellae]
MNLRRAIKSDLPALLEIHNDAVKSLAAIWTDALETLEDRENWFDKRTAGGFPIIIAENSQGEILGYGSYGPFREKSGYDKTLEHSVYIRPEAQGKGAGSALLQVLIVLAKQDQYHVLIGAIDSENKGSIRLHERYGFKVTGELPQVGFKFGRWLDLTLMTLILNDDEAPVAYIHK